LHGVCADVRGIEPHLRCKQVVSRRPGQPVARAVIRIRPILV
jgi:hypothetical protein